MKKWTYLVASVSAVLTMGSVLTSCVDNDEPYGIQEMRLAYAKLTESKAVLAQAQASAETAKAEAEKIKAQAEATKAEIKKIKAEAEAELLKAQAQATVLLAQAEAAKTEAEAAIYLAQAAVEQAKADRIKAETEAYLKEKQAELTILLAQAEYEVKRLELLQKDLLLQWEKEKANLTYWQTKFLAPFYASYFRALNAYNNAYMAYVQAQQANLEYQIDLGGKRYNEAKGYADAVKDAELQLAKAENALTAANEAYAEWENVQPDAVFSIISEYKDRCVELEAAIESIKVEKAAAELDLHDLYAQQNEILEEANGIYTEPVEIPNDGIDVAALAGNIPNPIVADLYTETGVYKLIGEGFDKFTLEEVDIDPDNNYTKAINEYNEMIQRFGWYILDENGQAWNEVKLNILKSNLENEKENLGTAAAQWAAAVAAYNKGQGMVYDKLPGWADFVKAVEAYNALVAKINPLSDAIPAAYANWEAKCEAADKILKEVYGNEAAAIEEKYNKAMDAANKAFQDAAVKANEAYATAAAKAQADYDKAVVAKQEAYDKAVKATVEASRKVDIALSTLGMDSKEYKDALEAYNKLADAEAAAFKAWNDAKELATPVLTEALAKANYARANAIDDAQNKFNDAKQKAADEAYAAAQAAGIDYNNDPATSAAEREQYAAAEKAREDALDAYYAAGQAYIDATDPEKTNPVFIDLLDAANALIDGIGIVESADYVIELWNGFAEISSEFGKLPEADAKTLSPINSLNIKSAVTTTSFALFGYFGNFELMEYIAYGLDTDEEGNPFADAFLVNLDQKAINAMITRYFNERGQTVNPFDIPVLYYNREYLGQTGVVLGLDTEIALHTAYMNNTEVIEKVINDLTTQLEAIQKTYEDQQAKYLDALAKSDEVTAQIAEIIDPLEKAQAEAEDLLGHYQDLVTAMLSAVDNLNEYVTDDNGVIQSDKPYIYTPSDIEAIKYQLQIEVESAQANLEKAQDNLAFAQHELAAYERHEEEIVPATEIKVMIAEQDLAVAQERLDVAKAALDKAIAAAEGVKAE